MNKFIKGRGLPALALIGIGLTGTAKAGIPWPPINMPFDSTDGAGNHIISSDEVLSTANTYFLPTEYFVLGSLTVPAGVVIVSDAAHGGGIVVARGGQIFVNGTATKPVIMTSTNDVATWTGFPGSPDPKTGTWREAVDEWANLTLCGNAYISSNNHGGTTSNTPVPNAANTATMEGLVPEFPGDTKVLYGGGNDDDDSGSIQYLSLRYGGKVIALNNELNGLSVGGVGRETTISHIDIMNNVDDGIETWGGTVNYKYISIWNIGDDCFDTDEGWRGKAQFGLLVNGYSVDAAQGSGVGDHGCEMDGAEDSNWQPVSTNAFYNFTIIMQPLNTRGTTAWRDNNRSQFHNSIFMDGGGEVVKFDNSDGDGAHGYGFSSSLSWNDTWTTAYNAVPAYPFSDPANPSLFYQSQTSGTLAEIVDSVFFRNTAANAYTEANLHNVFAPANNNVQVVSTADSASPIKQLVRGAPVVKGGKTELPVAFLDPRPQNDALTSVTQAPADGFFTPANYRGAFAPDQTWIQGWTAEAAFGFTSDFQWNDLGGPLAGVTGDPELVGSGPLTGGSATALTLSNAAPGKPAALFVSIVGSSAPFKGGVLQTIPLLVTVNVATNGAGGFTLPFTWPTGIPAGFPVYYQFAISDLAAVNHVSLSNAIKGISQ